MRRDGETWFLCADCARETHHDILFKTDQGNDVDPFMYTSHCVVECRGCKARSFLHVWQCRPPNVDNGDDPAAKCYEETLYPSRLAGRKKLEDYWHLPPDVRRIYDETFSALCGGQKVLSGVGIRMLVEAVCKERKPAGGTLEQRIDDLLGQGDLTTAQAAVLHRTRLLGNQAAHQMRACSEQELAAAMDVVEHLLTGVHVLPHRANELPLSKKI